MNKFKTTLIELKQDEDGASFLEYTVLLGIILAVAVTVIFAVGEYAGNIWAYLCDSGLIALNDSAGTAITGSCTSLKA